MAKADLIHKSEMSFARQMLIFKENIGPHAAALGLTSAQVAAQAADADYYYHVVTSHDMVQAHARAWTTLKRTLRRDKPAATPAELPALNLPAPVPAVTPGVEQRFRMLVAQIKNQPQCTRDIALELGIEAVNHVAPDYTTLQPRITATVNGDHVQVGWDWQGKRAFLDLCEIQVDRGNGQGFGPLVSSVKPGYVDKTPFPAAPVKWCYRAIYRVGNDPVGQWSNIVGVNVPP